MQENRKLPYHKKWYSSVMLTSFNSLLLLFRSLDTYIFIFSQSEGVIIWVELTYYDVTVVFTLKFPLMLSIGVLLYSLLKAQDRWSKRLPPLILFLFMIYFGLSAMDISSFGKRPLDIWLKWVVNSYENPLSLLLGLLLRWVASYPEHYIVSRLHGRISLFEVANWKAHRLSSPL